MAFCFISWIGLLKPLQLQTFTIMIVVPRHKGSLWPFLLSSVSSSKAAVASALGALRCATTILAKAVVCSGIERSRKEHRRRSLQPRTTHSVASTLEPWLPHDDYCREKREAEWCCSSFTRPSFQERHRKKMQPHFPLWRYFWVYENHSSSHICIMGR